MGILSKVAIYLGTAYVTSCVARYTYNYAYASSKDYVWNSVTGDTRDSTPTLSEAIFLRQTQTPEYKAFLNFIVTYGKTYASEDMHGDKF